MASSKKSKVPQLIWEWEKSKNHWCRYDEDIGKKLSARMKQKETMISIDGKGVKFDFLNMNQKAADTGYQRLIRCVVKNPSSAKDENFYAWEYLNSGVWLSLPSKIIAQIGAAYDNKYANSNFSIDDFEFDFKLMKVENGKTGSQHDFRRTKSDVATILVDTKSDLNGLNSNENPANGSTAKDHEPITKNLLNSKKEKEAKKNDDVIEAKETKKSKKKEIEKRGEIEVEKPDTAKITETEKWAKIEAKNGANYKEKEIDTKYSILMETGKSKTKEADKNTKIEAKVTKTSKVKKIVKNDEIERKEAENFEVEETAKNINIAVETKKSKRKVTEKNGEIEVKKIKKLKGEEMEKKEEVETKKLNGKEIEKNDKVDEKETKKLTVKQTEKNVETDPKGAKKSKKGKETKKNDELEEKETEKPKMEEIEKIEHVGIEARTSKRQENEKTGKVEVKESKMAKIKETKKKGKTDAKEAEKSKAEEPVKNDKAIVESRKSKRKGIEKNEATEAQEAKKPKIDETEKNDAIEENAKKSKSAGAKSKKTGSAKEKIDKKSGQSEEEGPKMKKILLKGLAPVDPECKLKIGNAHVFFENDEIFDCMLNQTNIGQNNNKYYLIQLLEDDHTRSFNVWLRWGRVGFGGQSNLIPFGANLNAAKDTFCKKFNEKTKNHWNERQNFQKVHGKYDLIEVDYSLDEKLVEETEGNANKRAEGETSDKKIVECKLDPRVQALLKLICDIKCMEQTVKEMEYDSQKAPLGKLTKSQIKAGYEALKKIETLLDQTPAAASSALAQACSEFYTRIPHSFGMKVPPLIRDKIMLKQKMDLLDTLSDIEVAIRVLKEETGGQDMHPLDRHYGALNRDLKPIERSSDEFKIIETYLINTHAQTHNFYTLKLLDLFACSKSEEDNQFMKDIGNRMLLWHGSRLSNWFGILNQGLRIAPPEAPCTGYMFGKGLYFADCASKSTNYCFATRSQNVGLAVLSEVALGKCKELAQSNCNADKLPPGHSSTKGVGRVAPDSKATITMEDGTLVPLGQLVNDKSKPTSGFPLNYNEYIVYNTNQVKMRYLAKIEFTFV